MTLGHLLLTLATTGAHLVLRDRRRAVDLLWSVATACLGPAAWTVRAVLVLAAGRHDVDAAEGVALLLEQAGLPGELVDLTRAVARLLRRAGQSRRLAW